MKSASPRPPLQVPANNDETNDFIPFSATPMSEAAHVLLRTGGPVRRKPRHHTAQRRRPYHHQAWHPVTACHKQQGNCRAPAGDSQGEWHHPEAPRVHTSRPNQEQSPQPSNLHQRWVPWSPAGQCTPDAVVEWTTTKVQETTVVNVYKPPPSKLQPHCRMPQLQLCKLATSTAGKLTGATRSPTQMARTWQTGHPRQTLRFCSTRRSPTRSSPGTGTPRPTQTWPSPKLSGKSHSRYSASWTGSLTPNIACHWSQHHRSSSRQRGNLSRGGTLVRLTGRNSRTAPTPQPNPCQCLPPPTSTRSMWPTARCWPMLPRNTSCGESERTAFPAGMKSARNSCMHTTRPKPMPKGPELPQNSWHSSIPNRERGGPIPSN